ncbi:MAG: ribose-5-phosphate isomerase RpiA [Anaerolineales bacterium]|nr:ribose-5-phosphate isomerase RpiA [Anaerolineales bacterium]
MELRKQAAAKALEYVQNGMTIGLGTGRTTAYFIDLLGERLRSGNLSDIRGAPTSQASAERARALGIPLVALAEVSRLDLAVDGADEVDPQLNLIKGLGRALLREKIIEIHAEILIIIVDQSKLVARLGQKGPLPVEILPFESAVHVHWLNSLGCRAEQWLEEDGSPVVTDNGNYLARCWFEGGIPDAYELARALAERPGIIEHGLFLDMASRVIVASENGVRVMERGK